MASPGKRLDIFLYHICYYTFMSYPENRSVVAVIPHYNMPETLAFLRRLHNLGMYENN